MKSSQSSERRRVLAPLHNNVRLAYRMKLRSSSSLTKSAFKKKPKKNSLPPVIIRPESPDADHSSSEMMILRPKHKSPPQSASEKKPKPEPIPVRTFNRVRKTLDDISTEKERMREQQNYVTPRAIPPVGFTSAEYHICSPSMWRRDYELLNPIPIQYKYAKEVMDQVRATRGYGVTLQCAGPGGGYTNCGFTPLMGKLENDTTFRKLADQMIRMVLDSMRREKGKYTSRGVEKLVKSSWNYFLTLGVSDPAGAEQIVEALFRRLPMGGPKNFKLVEWRINQGSDLVFTTADIIY